jgi:hypothetical protein
LFCPIECASGTTYSPKRVRALGINRLLPDKTFGNQTFGLLRETETGAADQSSASIVTSPCQNFSVMFVSFSFGKVLFRYNYWLNADVGFHIAGPHNENPLPKRRLDQESPSDIIREHADSTKRRRMDDAPSGPSMQHLLSTSSQRLPLQVASHDSDRMGLDIRHPSVIQAASPHGLTQGKFSVTEDELLQEAIAAYEKVRFTLCLTLYSTTNILYRILT